MYIVLKGAENDLFRFERWTRRGLGSALGKCRCRSGKKVCHDQHPRSLVFHLTSSWVYWLRFTIVAPQLPENSGAFLKDATKSVSDNTFRTISRWTPTPL